MQFGMRRSATGKLIFLMCDECDSVYLNPADIRLESGLYPSAKGDWKIPRTEEKISDGKSDWATLDEITTLEWESYIYRSR
jgi:hypothetical protein